jgi:hypothetical protein
MEELDFTGEDQDPDYLVRYNLAVNIIDGAVAGDENPINVMEGLWQLSQGEHREELLAVGKIVDKYTKARAHTLIDNFSSWILKCANYTLWMITFLN